MSIKTTRDAIREALASEMERDARVFLIGEDIAGGMGAPGEQDAWGGVFGVTKGLLARFGRERVVDTPISETAFLGLGIGAANAGLRPVVEIMFVDFFGVCFDQVLNNMAKFRYMYGGQGATPITVRTTYGAGYGAAGQHSQTLYPIFAHIPGIKIALPSNAYDAKGLLAAAIRDDDPVLFFEHKAIYDQSAEVPDEAYALPFGEAAVIAEGGDCCVVAFGNMVNVARQALPLLEKEGIAVTLVDPRTIAPLDVDTIVEAIEECGRLVVVDEASPVCSMASEIAALAATHCPTALKAPVVKVNPPAVPVPFSPALEAAYLPGAADIVAAVKRAMQGTPVRTRSA
ncbi:MAG: alpha-ketoacid dehydrogenase subunit beta [Gammaproteobacteria bacterium]|nr:alpha-ketoacid dehydrogenase subunit beta [Gammaproteobacteria bacterium]